MNKTLSLGKTIKKEIVFNSIDEIIADVFKLPENEANKKPLKLLSAHKKYLSNIVFKDRVSADVSKKYPCIILERDPELKVVNEIVTNVYNASNNEAKNSCINFFCDVVGEIKFLNPTQQDSNIFRSILSSLGENENALAYLINELNKKFDKRLEGITRAKPKSEKVDKESSSQAGSIKKSMTAAQLKVLRFNVIALATLWAVSLGKSSQSKAIDSFANLLTTDSEDNKPSISVESFLASNINSNNKKELGALISRFMLNQQQAHEDKRIAQSEALHLKSKLNTEIKNSESLRASLEDKEQAIDKLQLELQQLKEVIESKEQIGKAERVHLKDDTGKVKSKAINLLEEEVIPPLRTSLKALDRDEPKVKVAIHNIDVIIEEVEGALQWFKK